MTKEQEKPVLGQIQERRAVWETDSYTDEGGKFHPNFACVQVATGATLKFFGKGARERLLSELPSAMEAFNPKIKVVGIEETTGKDVIVHGMPRRETLFKFWRLETATRPLRVQAYDAESALKMLREEYPDFHPTHGYCMETNEFLAIGLSFAD